MSAVRPVLRLGAAIALLATGLLIIAGLKNWHPAYSSFALSVLLGGVIVALVCMIAGLVLGVLGLLAFHDWIATNSSRRVLMAWVLLASLALTALAVAWFILALTGHMPMRRLGLLIGLTIAAWGYLIRLYRTSPGRRPVHARDHQRKRVSG
jgi:hypothetical protein